jgi:hypothetical protein
MIALFGLGGRDVPDRLEKGEQANAMCSREPANGIEPIDPLEGANSTASRLRQGPRRRITSVLKVRGERASGPSAAPNDDRFGERVVIAVAGEPLMRHWFKHNGERRPTDRSRLRRAFRCI